MAYKAYKLFGPANQPGIHVFGRTWPHFVYPPQIVDSEVGRAERQGERGVFKLRPGSLDCVGKDGVVVEGKVTEGF